MLEIWKDIDGYEGIYQISNLGRVKSLARYRKTSIGKDRWYKTKILKNGTHTNGYKFVTLCKEGDYKYHSVHRLVAKHFILNLDNKKCVNHKDCVRDNNIVTNLEWVTYSENIYHARTVGSAKFCYIKKPQSIRNVTTGEVINFKTTKDVCEFFGKTKCWINNKRKQVQFPIVVDGWMIE